MRTDKERLDFLDSLTGKYTGKVILRDSTTGRGWRLHETSSKGCTGDVRTAIDNYIDKRGESVNFFTENCSTCNSWKPFDYEYAAPEMQGKGACFHTRQRASETMYDFHCEGYEKKETD